MAAGKYSIYTRSDAWLFPWLCRTFPVIANRFMDRQVKRAQAILNRSS